MSKKIRRAYILSVVDGVVQIGNTVFHVPTRQKFVVTMRGIRKLPYVLVSEKSFEGAKEALMKFSEKDKE